VCAPAIQADDESMLQQISSLMSLGFNESVH
jgi:hypothetical protein